MALADPDYIAELFSVFGPVTVRRMFGGAGIFAAGTMIGLISGDEIFLKADEHNSPAFLAEGMKPFEYGAKRSRIVMSYWKMPERLLDDPEELAVWARNSLAAAQRAAAKRNKPAPRGGRSRKPLRMLGRRKPAS